MTEQEALETLRKLSPWTAWVNEHPGEAYLLITGGIIFLLLILEWLSHFDFFKSFEKLWR